jgi:hypothetical protein
MADESRRVEIGFDGGQVLSLRLTDSQVSKVRDAVRDGQGWHDVETDEGLLSLELGKVVFVRQAGGSHSIGFSGK